MNFSLAASKNRVPLQKNKWLLIFIVTFLIIWTDSLIGTTDFANWLLENALVIISLIFLFLAYRKYQFSDLSYLLIFLFLCLHVYGSKYTYSENPLGFFLQQVFSSSRNQYDRIVHFSFGFLLAYPMREMFLKWLNYPRWVSWLLPIEITLSISGLYELIEWAVADLFFKEQGVNYLGTQGDVWDAQKDIFLAFMGAVLATTVVSLFKKLFQNHLE